MDSEIDLDELRVKARRAGLKLSDDELQKLLPGVNRARNQVHDLRELIGDSVEPAVSFAAR